MSDNKKLNLTSNIEWLAMVLLVNAVEVVSTLEAIIKTAAIYFLLNIY